MKNEEPIPEFNTDEASAGLKLGFAISSLELVSDRLQLLEEALRSQGNAPAADISGQMRALLLSSNVALLEASQLLGDWTMIACTQGMKNLKPEAEIGVIQPNLSGIQRH